jgi:two-component system, sensor histidine kinase and response regulator
MTMGHGGNRVTNQLPPWAILGLVLVIALAATAGIKALDDWEDVELHAQTLLADIEADAYRLSALEWQAIAEGRLDPEVEAAATATGTELEDRLHDLLSFDPDHHAATPLHEVTHAYRTAVAEEFRLLAAGDIAGARAVDETRVDPGFAALIELIDAEEALHREQAGRAERLFFAGFVGTLALAAVAIGVLLWRFERTRRAAAQLAGERQALAASEARFRALVEHGSDMISLTDATGVRRYASPAYGRVLGYRPEELLGRHVAAIDHPDDAARTREAIANLAQRPGAVERFEARVRHRDGSPRWLEVVAANRLDDPSIEGIVINSRDITERKRADTQLREAEAKYRTLVEQIPGVVYLLAADEDQTALYISPQMEELTGRTPEEVLTRTEHWLEHVHPDDRDRVAAELASGGMYRAEYRFRRTDGSYVWVEDDCVPIHDGAGQIVAWQGVMLDITERNQAEAALRAALEAAEAGNQAKSSFLAMMSHELRTPLQAVLGYAEFLLADPQASLSAEQRVDIDYIHQGGLRMLTLITQLLDLSRIEAGRLELVQKSVDLGRILEQVRQDVAPQAIQKGLELHIDVPLALPLGLGDAERLRQILLNLVGNAVKFTAQGSVAITAETTAGGVAVMVRDTGIGITPEALPHIFEAFRQVDSCLSRRHGGAGLGLAIAQKLAELMDGRISVESVLGEGSTFTLHLAAAPPTQR